MYAFDNVRIMEEINGCVFYVDVLCFAMWIECYRPLLPFHCNKKNVNHCYHYNNIILQKSPKQIHQHANNMSLISCMPTPRPTTVCQRRRWKATSSRTRSNFVNVLTFKDMCHTLDSLVKSIRMANPLLITSVNNRM